MKNAENILSYYLKQIFYSGIMVTAAEPRFICVTMVTMVLPFMCSKSMAKFSKGLYCGATYKNGNLKELCTQFDVGLSHYRLKGKKHWLYNVFLSFLFQPLVVWLNIDNKHNIKSPYFRY